MPREAKHLRFRETHQIANANTTDLKRTSGLSTIRVENLISGQMGYSQRIASPLPDAQTVLQVEFGVQSMRLPKTVSGTYSFGILMFHVCCKPPENCKWHLQFRNINVLCLLQTNRCMSDPLVQNASAYVVNSLHFLGTCATCIVNDKGWREGGREGGRDGGSEGAREGEQELEMSTSRIIVVGSLFS